ncbi:MAG: glycosyltransferase family 2 protein [Solirubrobacteraceae bacterium]
MRQISVCICTSGRTDELDRCLASIRDGSAQPARVHVSDDSRSRGTASLCATYGVEYVAGPARGLCANRNHVIAQADTSHVTLIDDDGVFGPHFLRDTTALLDSLGERELVCGTVVERSGPVGPTRSSYLGFFTEATRRAATAFHLNANVIPRSAFEYAAFDERIEYGYEDMDVAARLLAAGFSVTYTPHLVNYHLPPPRNTFDRTREQTSERARYLVALKSRGYRHRTPLAAQLAYATIAMTHSVYHEARNRRSVLAPIGDMSLAWKLARSAEAATPPVRPPSHVT